jgi:hypothetical protein
LPFFQIKGQKSFQQWNIGQYAETFPLMLTEPVEERGKKFLKPRLPPMFESQILWECIVGKRMG